MYIYICIVSVYMYIVLDAHSLRYTCLHAILYTKSLSEELNELCSTLEARDCFGPQALDHWSWKIKETMDHVRWWNLLAHLWMIDLHLKMGDFPASQTGWISGEYGVLLQIFPFFQFRSAAQGFRWNQLAVETAPICWVCSKIGGRAQPLVSSTVGNTSFWGIGWNANAGFSTFEQIMKDLKGIQFWDIPILYHSSTGTAGLRSTYPLLASQWRAGKGRTLTSQPCTPKKTDKCSLIRVAPTQWFALLVHGGQDTVTNPILELMMYGNHVHVPLPTNIEVSGKILWTQFRDYNKFGSFGFFPFQTLVIQENARPFLLTYHPLPETLGLWRCFDATTMSVQWFVRGPICVLPAICLGQ